jgi:23S rRNA pseudouridine1911/1915/1917 synthase
LGVTHRLDRPVSGALLFAKTSKALGRLNEMFKHKEIKKIYWAIVKTKPPVLEETLNHYLIKNQKKNKSFAYDQEVKDAKLASLTYKIIAEADNYYLLEVELHTGRHHQIRCQLAKIGCPVKGDLKYGFPRSNADGGISLHARKIEFIHPVKKESIEIVAPTPDDSLWNYFDTIVN